VAVVKKTICGARFTVSLPLRAPIIKAQKMRLQLSSLPCKNV